MFSLISRMSVETLLKWRIFWSQETILWHSQTPWKLFSSLALKPDFGLCMAIAKIEYRLFYSGETTFHWQ